MNVTRILELFIGIKRCLPSTTLPRRWPSSCFVSSETRLWHERKI